jgi:hypothetical protein
MKERSPGRPGHHPIWLLALLGLAAWQVWMALGLFGPDPFRALTSDEPLMAGRHPLHLYHGYLGARSLLERGTLSVYDPAFHAGYPKTPVFDSGSRPAELALALAGGQFSPAVYKGLQLLLCLFVPLAAFIGARGVGLSRGTGVLAALLSQCVWWGRPGRESLEAGDSDLLFASLMAVCQAGLLARYHRKPGTLPLLGAMAAGLAGWFAHPLLMVLLLPSFLLYYLAAGPRHSIGWHLPLFGGLLLAIGANWFWLRDLAAFWWVRVPPDLDTPLVTRTFAGVWRSNLWGDILDRGVGTGILLASLVGLTRLYRLGERPAAYLFSAAGVGMFALSLAGLMSDLLGRLGASQMIVAALLFACVPSACGVAWALERVRVACGSVMAPIGLVAALALGVWLLAPAVLRERAARLARPVPWEVGLGEGRQAVLEALRERTTADARILWEDRPLSRGEPRWTALLPVLTGRWFVGGLDAGASIEHTATGLVAGCLAGRPMEEKSDAELEAYCSWYNVGWVVTWSEESARRLAKWTAGVAESTPLPAEGLTLWRLRREPRFARVGEAQCVQAGPNAVLLADARPCPKGTIELSMHYLEGMTVSPERVKLQPAEYKEDKVRFIRLILKEPAGRILITWGRR